MVRRPPKSKRTERSFPKRRASDLEQAAFRISRDAEMELDDEGGRAFVEALEDELRKRRRGQVVRLEVDDRISEQLLGLLRSEEHTSELQSLMRISYAVFCLIKKKII